MGYMNSIHMNNTVLLLLLLPSIALKCWSHSWSANIQTVLAVLKMVTVGLIIVHEMMALAEGQTAGDKQRQRRPRKRHRQIRRETESRDHRVRKIGQKEREREGLRILARRKPLQEKQKLTCVLPSAHFSCTAPFSSSFIC